MFNGNMTEINVRIMRSLQFHKIQLETLKESFEHFLRPSNSFFMQNSCFEKLHFIQTKKCNQIITLSI